MLIAYGNTLRGDDGVGPAVAALVSARAPDVRTLVVPMLVPELAPIIAQRSIVVFVDARAGDDPGCLRVEPIDPDGEVGAMGHLLGPRTLLGLAQRLYAGAPRAFQVSIDAAAFDVGAPLSAAVAAAVPRAADVALGLLRM
jgi:hydrogenase maturation protease